MKSPISKPWSQLGWVALALFGAGAIGYIAVRRGETINAVWIVAASAQWKTVGSDLPMNRA